MADRKKKRNIDWRLQLLRGELCPHAACRSSTASAIPTWKCSHLLHTTTHKMLVSSSIPCTHKQFCLCLWNTVQYSVTTNLKTVSTLKFIGFPSTAHTIRAEHNSIWSNFYLSICLLFIVLFSKVRQHLSPLMFMSSLNCTSLHLIYTGCHVACLLNFNFICLNLTWREYLTLKTHFNLSGDVCVLSRHLPRF